MMHVLKRLVKEKFSSCLSTFSTIGTSPLTIRQSSSGGQSGWDITGSGKDSQGIDYMSIFCHMLRENGQKIRSGRPETDNGLKMRHKGSVSYDILSKTDKMFDWYVY